MAARDVAEAAVRGWQAGAASGDWSALVDLLADAVRVTMPFEGEWHGEKVGRSAAAELFRHAAEDLAIRLEQRATSPLLGDGDRFAIELVGEGTVGGKPATVPICLWFTVREGRIAAIREYAGDAP